MKVILEGFNGLLRSEPMDWPDNSSYEIKMMLDLDMPNVFTSNPEPETFRPLVGRFRRTGRYVIIGGSRTAEIYKLIGIDKH